MTEQQLQRLWVWLRRPIPWDPVPPWLRLKPDQLAKFNEVQTQWNAKIAEIEQQKVQELAKITGMKL
ncbi:MAG: hypothetical protein AB9869_30095 [Verrucomicrobiia bacterium]